MSLPYVHNAIQAQQLYIDEIKKTAEWCAHRNSEAKKKKKHFICLFEDILFSYEREERKEDGKNCGILKYMKENKFLLHDVAKLKINPR
jgi:hypothetical protein